MPQGPPQGLMAPPPPDPNMPPAASAIQGLAPLVPAQQQIMDMVKQKLAEQTMAAAMQAVAGMPNEAAMAAQTEPSPPVDAGSTPTDLQSQGL
jgi:hypothetical protein